MLKLENVPPEKMPEVVRIAAELYEKDQDEQRAQQERHATVEAAAEAGLPEEYLQRAAQVLHERQVIGVRQRTRSKMSWLALGLSLSVAILMGALLILYGSMAIVPTAVDAPATLAMPVERVTLSVESMTLNHNPQSSAELKLEEQGSAKVAHLTVRQFGFDPRTGKYFVNLDLPGASVDWSRHRSVSFRGRGSLPNLRLYLEAGQTMRWRSRALPLSNPRGDWKDFHIDFDKLEFQTRNSPRDEWSVQSYRPPADIQTLSFKAGHFINDVNARGDLRIGDVRLE